MGKVSLNPITYPCGTDNMGGYKAYVLFIPACAVSAVPELPAITDQSTDANYVTAAGTFTFNTEGDQPKFIACTDKTVKYGAENQGELEGQSFVQSGEFFRAGSKVEADAFARQVNNTPGYVVIEDMDGKQILVGQPGLLANIKPSYDGGMARADRRGYKFTFEADSISPKIYLATPIDVDAILNPPVTP